MEVKRQAIKYAGLMEVMRSYTTQIKKLDLLFERERMEREGIPWENSGTSRKLEEVEKVELDPSTVSNV